MRFSRKTLIFTIMYIVLICNIVKASNIIFNNSTGPFLTEVGYDRVAVVGNSNGSLFSFVNNIDRDDSVDWQNEAFSNNAAGGDTIDSIINYPNTNIPILSTFVNRVANYDYVILWLGTNEIHEGQMASIYKFKLERYIHSLITVNPNVKILLMQIPMAFDGDGQNLFAQQVPIFNLAHQEVANLYPQVDVVNYDSINPKITKEFFINVHLTTDTLRDIWSLIQSTYGLNVIRNNRDLTPKESVDMDKRNSEFYEYTFIQ